MGNYGVGNCGIVVVLFLFDVEVLGVFMYDDEVYVFVGVGYWVGFGWFDVGV